MKPYELVRMASLTKVRIPYTVLKSFTLEDLMSDKYLIN